MKAVLVAVLLGSAAAGAHAASGEVDPTFNVLLDARVFVVKILSDERLLVGGTFSNVNEVSASALVRLNADGSADPSFRPKIRLEGFPYYVPAAITRVAVQRDGKIIIAGRFTHVNDVPRTNMARLNPDGSLDRRYKPNPYRPLSQMHVLPDGKLLFGSAGVVRLNRDGSYDSSFRVQTNPYGEVFAVTIQRDGKILVGGTFYMLNDALIDAVARVNPDGTLDSTFNTQGQNIGEENRVLIEQDDGTIMMGGDVTAKLTPNGRLSPDFRRRENNIPTVVAMVVRDGRPVIGGHFYASPPGVTNLTRILPTGGVDPQFEIGTGVNGDVRTIVQQKDGHLLVGGDFTEVNGQPRAYLVRLQAIEPPPEVTTQRLPRGQIAVCWPTNYADYTLQATRHLRPRFPQKEKWVTVTNTPIEGESSLCVTNRIVRWGRHYRLVKE